MIDEAGLEKIPTCEGIPAFVSGVQALIDDAVGTRAKLDQFPRHMLSVDEARKFCASLVKYFRAAKKACGEMVAAIRAAKRDVAAPIKERLDDLMQNQPPGYMKSWAMQRGDVSWIDYEHDALIGEVEAFALVLDDWIVDARNWRDSV